MGNGSAVNIDFFVILASIIFVIGAFGVLIRRNMIVLLMCIELMLNAVNILMVAFSTYYNNADAQIFVFFIIVVAAAEASIGLSILILAYRHLRSIDVGVFNQLKG